MTLPELRGQGRALTDPRSGTTGSGTPWCSLLLKFPSWKKTDDGWKEQPDSPVASVVAYDDLAAQLAKYAKGDDLGVLGTTKLSVWKDKPQFSITASQLWTPERKPRQAAKRDQPAPPTTGLTEARSAASASLRQLDARLSASPTESAA